jgi:glutaminase
MNTKRINRLLIVMLSATGLPTSGGAAARAADLPASTEIEAALNAAYDKYRTLQDGKNTDYIPALSKEDQPRRYGTRSLPITAISPGGRSR